MANLIGTGLNQVPTNGLLGNMAFQNKEAVSMDLLATGRITVSSPALTTYGLFDAATDGYAYLTFNDRGTTVGYLGPHAMGTGNRMGITSAGANPLLFGTNGTERMRIDANGNMGIGTTTPRNPGAGYQGIVLNGSTSGFLDLNTNGTRILTIFGLTNDVAFANPTATGAVAFYTNNTERLRLDASGNLGLGVTPSAWGGTSRALQFPTGAIEGRGAGLSINANAYFNGSNWIYSTNAGAALYNITNGSDHQWYVAASGTAGNAITFTQAMTLTSAGNLGIGTTAPGAKLDVNGNIYVRTGSFLATDTISTYTGLALNISAATNMVFNTNSTERMRIDASGNLGLGVTPAAWSTLIRSVQFGLRGNLQSSGNTVAVGYNSLYDTGGAFKYQNNDFALEYRLNSANGSHTWWTAPSGTAGNTITFTQAMTLSSDGRLLVGTTSASGRITVVGAGNQINVSTAGNTTSHGIADISVNRSGAASYGVGLASNIQFNNTTTGSQAILQSADGGFQFWSNPLNAGWAERMRIDSLGNVGIGTLSPSYKLDVAAGDGPTLRIYSTFVTSSATTAYAILHGNRTGTGGAATELRFANTEGAASVAETGVAAIKTWRTAANKLSIAFETGAAERMRITDAGNVQVGTASLATTATDGFPYIPTCAGVPTGTPTAITGFAPMVVDSTNNKLYVYVGGAWQAMN